MDFAGTRRGDHTGTLRYYGEVQTAAVEAAVMLFEDIETAYWDWPDLRPSFEEQMDLDFAAASAQPPAAAAPPADASALGAFPEACVGQERADRQLVA